MFRTCGLKNPMKFDNKKHLGAIILRSVKAVHEKYIDSYRERTLEILLASLIEKPSRRRLVIPGRLRP